MLRTIFAFAFALVFGAAPIRADDAQWARFRGPNGLGQAVNQDLPVKFSDKDGIAWKIELPGLGNSSPVIWNDMLFLQTSSKTGDERMLLCLDSRTGKQIWSRNLPGKKATIHPKNTLASSTPATDGESVFVSFWDGKEVILAAYSVKGEPLWHKAAGAWVGEHGAGASPIVYKDKVILYHDIDQTEKDNTPAPHSSKILALNKKTGSLAWVIQRESFRACYSTPIFLEKTGATPQLIISSTTGVNGYNPDTGTELWRWQWTFSSKRPLRTISMPFFADGLLMVTSGDGAGDRQAYAVSMNGTPKEVWGNKKDLPYVTNCLTVGPNIYFVNDRGFAGCFEAKTGNKIWMERLPEATFSASPVLVDGKVYACSEQGDVFVFGAEPTFKMLAQNPLGEVVRATPAVADGRLYIRGGLHLYCISKKKS